MLVYSLTRTLKGGLALDIGGLQPISLKKKTTRSMNKLSLVGMQLPEKYKENFDVSSEGPSPYIFQVIASTKACSFDWHYLYTLAKTVQDNKYDPLSANGPFALQTKF